MKKIKPFLLLVLFFGSILSCDELDELLSEEIEITRSFTGTASINYDEFDVEFSETGSVNFNFITLEANGQMINSDQINKIEIQSVKYEFKNFSGNVDAVTIGSYFTLGSTEGNQDFLVEDTNVAQADLLGTLFNVPANFGIVNDFMKDSKVFVYTYGGSLSDTPAIFDVEFTVTVKIFIEVSL